MRTELSMPVLGGHEQFDSLVRDYGGAARVAADFRVAVDLVNRWTSGEQEVPKTAMLALYWHTGYGVAQAYRESHWTHEYMCFLRNEARDRVELLERLIVQAGYLVPPGRLTSDAETVGIPADGWQAHKTTVERPALSLVRALPYQWGAGAQPQASADPAR